MRRLVYLAKAIAISPALIALWLFKECFFGAMLGAASLMVFLRPRNVEWMPKEAISEQKKQADSHFSGLIDTIWRSLKQG